MLLVALVLNLGAPHMSCGVPQGSVLGPLLFLTHINDLGLSPNKLSCLHYADDTVLYLTHDPAQHVSYLINKDLK